MAVVIHETEAGEAVLDASFTGRCRALTDRALLAMLLAYPLMTLKVVAAIHFEAVRLMLKGVRRHPACARSGRRNRLDIAQSRLCCGLGIAGTSHRLFAGGA